MNRTERIFKIERLIVARRPVSFREPRDELEVSTATSKREYEVKQMSREEKEALAPNARMSDEG